MNIPEIHHARRVERFDTMTKSGAIRLACIIKSRWLDCGYVVGVWCEETKRTKDCPGAWGVRSDMVNGMPVSGRYGK